MVHALRKVHSLLGPESFLIDIHPVADIIPVEVHTDGNATHVGRLHQTSEGIHYLQADDALAEAIREGMFTVQDASQFTIRYHADTVAELQAYLQEDWSSTSLDEDTIQRIKELLRESGIHDIVVQENVHIARLAPTF